MVNVSGFIMIAVMRLWDSIALFLSSSMTLPGLSSESIGFCLGYVDVRTRYGGHTSDRASGTARELQSPELPMGVPPKQTSGKWNPMGQNANNDNMMIYLSNPDTKRGANGKMW